MALSDRLDLYLKLERIMLELDDRDDSFADQLRDIMDPLWYAFSKDMLLVSVTLLDQETAHLKIDLRPIGMLIFDDHEGLHIGSNVLVHASFSNCMTAIGLG